MDKQHHHERRRHSHRARESETPSRVNRHQILPDDSVSNLIRRDKQSIPADISIQEQRHNGSSIRLGRTGNDDYVQRWLAEAKGDITVDNEVVRWTQKKYQHEKVEVETGHRHDRKKLRRKHNSSSDSSLLEAPARPRSHMMNHEGINKTRMGEQEDPLPHTHKRRRVVSIPSRAGSATDDSRPRKETFEKRPRHKIREERYEPNPHSRKYDETDKKNRTTTKRPKKSGQKKAAKGSGEDLMHNFTSKSIGGERLTLRPSYGVGLFNNGRASYPAKRKGLSDLAFSEMEFLQHSNRRSPSATIKLRRTENQEYQDRRPQREQEISAFFPKSRKPLYEINCNAGTGQSPTYKVPREFVSQGRDKKSLSDLENRARLDRDGTSIPRRMPFIERNLGSSSKLSGEATTYVTWSESQFPPVAANTPSRHLRNTNHGPNSSTPDSIRNCLESTGIFRNTGIERRGSTSAVNDRFILNQSRQRPGQDHIYQNSPLDEHDFTTISSNRHAGSSPYRRCRASITQLPDNITDTGHHIENAREEMPGATLNNRDKIGSIEVGTNSIVNDLKSQGGEQQRLSPRPEDGCSHEAIPRSVMPEKSPSTTITREQLAKHARIKHLSTALPVTGLAGVGCNMTESNGNFIGTQPHMQLPATISRGQQVDMRDIVQGPDLEASFEPTVTNTEAILNSVGDAKSASHSIPPSAQRSVPDEFNLQSPSAREGMHSQSGISLPSWANYVNNPRFQAPNSDHPPQNSNPERTNSSAPQGLPLRGGWRYNFGVATRLSPLGRVDPVFVRQAQQDYDAPGEFIQLESSQMGDTLTPFKSMTTSLANSPAPDSMRCDENGVILQGDAYDHQMYDTNGGLVEPTYTDMPNLGGNFHQYCDNHLDEVVDPNTHDGYCEYYMPTHASDNQADIPIEVTMENYHHGDEGSYSIQRFWTPHRQY
ncbi:uncharacterized protein BP5553_05995 [Venustampulla echinocandica]|uniref:Uncharacterized protein n=1 Tax=Venustampulla echinocandica TaxID=2656787 RepID=A0A370TM88_9HELO|nr:uncharacterized protein BP5553_05995 [Venustampulla echinocandica]RDL36643.1 hypothetical protein BP5553_05995 [Venustampulla echinocandica]